MKKIEVLSSYDVEDASQDNGWIAVDDLRDRLEAILQGRAGRSAVREMLAELPPRFSVPEPVHLPPPAEGMYDLSSSVTRDGWAKILQAEVLRTSAIFQLP